VPKIERIMSKQLRKLTSDKKKVYENVFDEFTLRTIFKLSSQGFFDELESPIALGKEANVFTAKKGDSRVVVKIYRVQSCDFGKMFEYIRNDPRYYNIRKTKRNIIFSWVQREFRNLTLAREGNVRVPIPIAFKNNVLVLEYIGDNDPAPKLVNCRPKAKKKIFDDVIVNMKKLFKAGFIHADLSAFNILLKDDKPYFIDFSQTSPINSVDAGRFIKRDVKNVCNFFTKIGLTIDQDKVLKSILER